MIAFTKLFAPGLALLFIAGASRCEAQAHTANSCPVSPNEKVALVLPGGGSKGMAHVGVIKVLDSLGIVPDIVVGTSMGAIVGGMYASGYSGVEIERLTQRFNIGAYIGRYAPRPPHAFAISGAGGASLLSSELPGEPEPVVLLEEQSAGFALATSFADEGAINLLLTALFVRGDMLARGSFDSLPIPFRAVATDLHTGERVVLGQGDLAEAIRASVAIPIVFQPISLGGRQLVDGGLTENVPVRLARELGATRVILSLLNGIAPNDTGPPSSTAGALDMMLNRIFIDAHPPLGPADVEISTDVSDISNLDFSAGTVARLIDRGAAAARLIPSSACLARPPRIVPQLPAVSSSIVTPNAEPGAEGLLRNAVAPTDSHLPKWIRSLLGQSTSAPPKAVAAGERMARLDTIQSRLASSGTSGLVRALWLNPQQASGDSVAFNPVIRWPERRVIGVGAAYDNDLGGQAWVALTNRLLVLSHGLPTVDAGGRITFGTQRQEGFISLRRAVNDVRYSVSPFGVLLASRESAPFFQQNPNGSAVKVELPIMSGQLLQLGADIPIGETWSVQAGGVFRRWHGGLVDSARTPTAVGIAMRLDNSDDLRGRLGRIDLEWNDRYRRASARLSQVTHTRLALLSSTIRVGAVTDQAPYSGWFLLGGTDGFPGLNIGEAVGTRTASYMLELSRPLAGLLSAQVTGMTGTVAGSTEAAFSGKWLFGTRVGIGAESPIGPVRLQYGLSTTGRRQWFARVGRWI